MSSSIAHSSTDNGKVRHHADDADAAYLQAGVFRQVGLARRVKRETEAALALDPNHLGALELMMGFYREAPSIMGGDTAKVNALLERLRKISPADAFLADAVAAIRQAVKADPRLEPAKADLRRLQ